MNPCKTSDKKMVFHIAYYPEPKVPVTRGVNIEANSMNTALNIFKKTVGLPPLYILNKSL